MKSFTTLRIGGPAAALLEASSPEAVVSCAKNASMLRLPWRVIGEGSNILASDEGVKGAVIVFRDPCAPQAGSDGLVGVSGGYPLSGLVSFLCERGLGGLENLAGIPGTVGGAIAGNAGAYGRSIGERLRSATLLHQDGSVQEVAGERLGFAYRHSNLKESRAAVLEAVIETTPGQSPQLLAVMKERLADRAEKHPDYRETPTAGSWFKNVKGADGSVTSAGRLLDEAGCRGLTVGGASLWHKHANIVVTDGNATARDVLSLTQEMASRVMERFGMKLAREVCWME